MRSYDSCAHAVGADAERAQSLRRIRLCGPADCSPPGSSVRGNFQARILEWAAIPYSQILNKEIPKGPKDQLPLLQSWEQKQGAVHDAPTGWANHLSCPSSQTPGHSLPLTLYKEQAHLHPPQGTSRESCHLSSIPPAASGAPVKLSLDFLSSL